MAMIRSRSAKIARKLLYLLPVFLLLQHINAGCPESCRCDANEEAICIGKGLTSIPPCIDCDNIHYLDLSHNNITELLVSPFKDYPKLRRLFFNNNKIHTIDLLAFSELPDLKETAIVKNNVSNINPKSISFLPSITSLSLSDNPLVISSPFLSSDTLTQLDLTGCQLKSLPSDTFALLPELMDVSLKDNDLTELPYSIFEPLDKLENVQLHGNPWRCGGHLKQLMETKPEIISDLKRVECKDADVRAVEKEPPLTHAITQAPSSVEKEAGPNELDDASSADSIASMKFGYLVVPVLASLLRHNFFSL